MLKGLSPSPDWSGGGKLRVLAQMIAREDGFAGSPSGSALRLGSAGRAYNFCGLFRGASEISLDRGGVPAATVALFLVNLAVVADLAIHTRLPMRIAGSSPRAIAR